MSIPMFEIFNKLKRKVDNELIPKDNKSEE